MMQSFAREGVQCAAAALFAAAAALPCAGQCQVAKLTSDDGSREDRFSFGITIAAGDVIVGAPFTDDFGSNTGSTYVFSRHPTWSQTDELLLDDAEVADGFGRAVAGGIDWMASTVRTRRMVLIHEKVGESWLLRQELQASVVAPDGLFGEHLASDGDRLLIGAPRDVVDGARIGSTFVFDRDLNGVWVESAKLLGHGGLSGSSVAVHGDVIVMGSPSRAPSGLGSGSAYAFELDPNGAWVETAELLPDLGHSFQGFGRSVATDGELILVGAEGDISGPGTSLHGAAYVFERDESDGWTQTGKFTTTDHGVIDFGWSLAMEGDLVVVGARHFDGPAPASGAAYVFWRESDGSWTQLARLQPDDLGQRDEFGYSVALRGHLAVVGAPFQRLRREDGTVADEVGAAYVFAVGPDLDGDGIMDACLCPGDVDGDFNVNFTDLATVLHNFGQVDDDPDGGGDGDSDPACQTWPTRCAGDLDRDGDVDISDLGILLANWGSVCP